MKRVAWSIGALVMLACAGIAGYTLATGGGDTVPSVPEVEPVTQQSDLPATTTAPTPEIAEPAGITAATIAQWAADSMGPDAEKRAEAIAALANAPRADAIPALLIVLTSGESRIDRPLALRSLRALAQRDGDDDGAIRDVLRQAIYHDGNEEFTRAAQSTLDEVEGLLTQR